MADEHEKALMASVEAGEWREVPEIDGLKSALMEAARQASQKDYRINIRISGRDVERLKAKAMEDGIPYQTLVSSILHKYVSGRLREK